MTKTRLSVLISVFLIFISVSCATTSAKGNLSLPDEALELQELAGDSPEWEELQAGIEYTSFKISKLKVTWHCIKIDLSNQEIKIVSEPKTDAADKVFKLKKFARSNNTVVAINTSPFVSVKNPQIVGITKIDGNQITQPEEKYSALCFYYDDNFLRAKIIKNQNQSQIENMSYAFGAFYAILADDTIYEFKQIRRSRTCAGINEDGSTLFLMVATPDFDLTDNNGLSYEECAKILQFLGCKSALQFDGGHSSGMCIYQKDVAKPLFQRKIPAALGFISN